MHTKQLYFACLIGPLLLPIIGSAAVYKWVDEDGKIVYGDKPVSKEEADKIDIKKAPKQDNYSKQRYQEQQKLLDVFQQERDEKIAAEEKQREEKEKRQQECVNLIKELKELKEASLLYEDTDDPNNPKIISDEERKTEEAKYQEYIDKNC